MGLNHFICKSFEITETKNISIYQLRNEMVLSQVHDILLLPSHYRLFLFFLDGS